MNKKHKNVIKNTLGNFSGIIMISKVYAVSSFLISRFSLFTLSLDISNILFR